DNNGYMDVFIGQPAGWENRLWLAQAKTWHPIEIPFPMRDDGPRRAAMARFGIVQSNGCASFLYDFAGKSQGGMQFDGGEWRDDASLDKVERRNERSALVLSFVNYFDCRLRDLDHDGRCELIVGDLFFEWSNEKKCWTELPFSLPGNYSAPIGSDK